MGCAASAGRAPERAVPSPGASVGSAVTAASAPATPSSAPAATPAAPETPAPTRTAELPLDVPLSLLAAAPDGSWVAYCSAEADSDANGKLEVTVDLTGDLRGDALSPRLAVADRAPLSIDTLYDSDPSGRFVLAELGGVLTLIDTSNGATTDLNALGADTRNDVSELPGHRAVSFSPAGGRVAYLRKVNDRADVVVRELASGAERSFSAGTNEIYRIAFDASGSSLIQTVVATDSNKNGRLDWPLPPARTKRAACRSPLARLPARYPQGDVTTTVVLSLASGTQRTQPGFIALLSDGPVQRRESRELTLDNGGNPTTLTTAKCEGRVLHADAPRSLLVVGCAGKKIKSDVWLVAKGFQKDLGFALQTTELDATASAGTRLVPLYPGLDAQLVDLERREALALKSGDLVVATFGARALVRRKDRLVLYDAESKSETLLEVTVERLPHVLVQGPFAVVTPAVVNLEQGKLAGTTRQRPLALSRSGKLLVAEGGAPSAERLARGPLRWKDPESATGQ